MQPEIIQECENGNVDVIKRLLGDKDHYKWNEGTIVKLVMNGDEVYFMLRRIDYYHGIYSYYKVLSKDIKYTDEQVEDEYTRWKYRIGGSKYKKAKENLTP